MQPPKETKHNRTQFQIDRIAFFSDAVIAIAITLMVLEIKIPELGKNITFEQVWKQYGGTLVMHILALVIGFITIGNLWMRHHELFEHIVNYNKRLIRFNLYFLFTVMLLPITISFLFTENQPARLKNLFYFLNLFFCSLSYGLILVVIFHKKNNFSGLTDKAEINKIRLSAFSSVLVLLCVLILLVLKKGWFYVPFLIPPIIDSVYKRMNKKSRHKRKTVAPNESKYL